MFYTMYISRPNNIADDDECVSNEKNLCSLLPRKCTGPEHNCSCPSDLVFSPMDNACKGLCDIRRVVEEFVVPSTTPHQLHDILFQGSCIGAYCWEI